MNNKSIKVLKTILTTVGLFGIFLMSLGYLMQYCPNWWNLSPDTQEWIKDVYTGLGGGIFGSVILFFLVDYFIISEDRNEKEKRNQIALDALRDLLKSHFEAVLFGMYRAAVIKEKQFNSLKEFFTEDYFKGIESLDFNKSPFTDGEPVYSKLIPSTNDKFSRYLREEVIQFGQYLDPEIIELVRQIRFSKFMKLSPSLPNMLEMNYAITVNGLSPREAKKIIQRIINLSPNGFPWNYHEEFYKGLREHVVIFQQLVELHDKYTTKEKLLNALLTPNTGKVTMGCCRVDEEITPSEHQMNELT